MIEHLIIPSIYIYLLFGFGLGLDRERGRLVNIRKWRLFLVSWARVISMSFGWFVFPLIWISLLFFLQWRLVWRQVNTGKYH